MASYESARTLAKQLGQNEVAELLTQTLREEIEADKTLAQISKKLLRQKSGATGERGTSGRSRSSSRSESAGTGRSSNRGRTSSRPRGSQRLIEEDEIRRWAEDRGAKPTCVKGTGRRGDVGMIRLDFPGYSGEESLQPISWDEWFQKFEENQLALLVQETTARGEKSNFNKLVKRSAAERRPKARAAR